MKADEQGYSTLEEILSAIKQVEALLHEVADLSFKGTHINEPFLSTERPILDEPRSMNEFRFLSEPMRKARMRFQEIGEKAIEAGVFLSEVKKRILGAKDLLVN